MKLEEVKELIKRAKSKGDEISIIIASECEGATEEYETLIKLTASLSVAEHMLGPDSSDCKQIKQTVRDLENHIISEAVRSEDGDQESHDDVPEI